MTQTDARAFVRELARYGIALEGVASPDVAVCSSDKLLSQCDWLSLGRMEGHPVAWLATDEPGDLVVPEFERTSEGPQLISRKELAESYEFLGSKALIEIFREKSTGKMLYIGRTQSGGPPSYLSGSEIQQRYMALAEELSRLGGLEDDPPRDYQGDLRECYERTKKLVEDTQATEPGPLQLQGIAARLLKRWDEAAALFRKVTEMRPDYVDGWLELTRALAALGRLEEAEASARKAVDLDSNSQKSLGNLAAVLFQQKKLEDARSLVNKALMANPMDAKNKLLLILIQRAQARERSWLRPLFRRSLQFFKIRAKM
jgi:tetratricopeptide (TPR) repeat protein